MPCPARPDRTLMKPCKKNVRPVRKEVIAMAQEYKYEYLVNAKNKDKATN